MLLDRLAERAALGQLLEAARGGRSGVLVVRGVPGVGKTALLEDLVSSAPGFTVVRAAGVESEMELAFAGLHQLCGPLLGRLEALPDPQRDALGVAFGLSAGNAPDRFLVGLAALSLLSQVAEERPLLCVIDDAQWLDRASAQALGFVARRLLAEPVALLVVAREPGGEFAGLPELVVGNLSEGDARQLLGSAVMGPLDARVRDRIVAEAEGNPLALLELPRALSPAELAGGYGQPGAPGLAGRIEDSFVRRMQALPAGARRLLLIAAAEPAGDAVLVWRAAETLGIGLEAAAAAEACGLLAIGARVIFRHPLVRSAVYRAADPAERRLVHRALAEATDPGSDPDRRAWHRAQAAPRPDEDVAAELESSAGRTRARGGLAAAAAFLERSAALTVDPPRRAERALAAAQAKYQAGAFDGALGLLAAAEAGPLDEFAGARADLLRGQIAFASGLGSDAPPLLLKAAKRLEPLNLDLARETYLDAWHAAMFAGHLARAGDLAEVSCAARALPGPAHARPSDLLLDGLALWVTDGTAAAAPVLRQATAAFASADMPVEDVLRWGWMAREADKNLWDDAGWSLTVRQVQLARDAGALDRLPFLLNVMALDAVYSGDLAAAGSLIAEADVVCEATGSRIAPYAAMMLASFRGREAEATALIQATLEEAEAGGQGVAVTWAHRVAAILYNGLGRHPEALAAGRQASEHKHVYVSVSTLPELIEAAVRTGNTRMASDALDLLTERTRAGGTEGGLGIEARCRALLSEGQTAEGYYREALDRLGRTRRRPDLARARLLYGEWLRRQGRRPDARDQIRTAIEMFDAMGMEAFAGRARVELRAVGERTRPQSPGAPEVLTVQEALIARLAGDGSSNAQIAAQLFISPATVAYHLGKVFGKLGISSRHQLAGALAAQRASGPRVTAQT
jgi:DNA-binding CsgD family transcriptional regulator